MVAILDLVEKYFDMLRLLYIKLNPVETLVAILDLVECQLIEAVTARNTFPKLPDPFARPQIVTPDFG